VVALFLGVICATEESKTPEEAPYDVRKLEMGTE
jgi:hypothetical protein